MKDKNGYTIPEVLAVITVISIVMILTISYAATILDKTKKKITDVDKRILLDAAITYGEDLDKNDKSYFLINDMSLSSGTIIRNGAEVNGYALKELINANNTLPVRISKLYELGYIDKNKYKDCNINLVFETSTQDGYIVIDKINANLGEDCK